jgi:hypothetical protein
LDQQKYHWQTYDFIHLEINPNQEIPELFKKRNIAIGQVKLYAIENSQEKGFKKFYIFRDGFPYNMDDKHLQLSNPQEGIEETYYLWGKIKVQLHYFNFFNTTSQIPSFMYFPDFDIYLFFYLERYYDSRIDLLLQGILARLIVSSRLSFCKNPKWENLAQHIKALTSIVSWHKYLGNRELQALLLEPKDATSLIKLDLIHEYLGHKPGSKLL